MNRKNAIWQFALAALLLAAGANLAYAQLTAQITGTINDASGAVVPNANITLANEGTGVKWEATSNAAGIYVIPMLGPGSYSITVAAPGFQPFRRSGIRLHVAQTAALNFTLQVGAETQSITVTDTTPVLDSNSGAIGGVVTLEQVQNMPLLGRNSNALAVLQPGIRATKATTANPVLESHYQFFSINGSRPNQSQFILDGGNNSNLTFNGPEYSPQVEEVQEIKIQTSNFSAEYAMAAGGVINAVSRGGTNEFHGSLFEYFRNDVLSANDFFSNRASRPRSPLRYNQFGGTIGGPVIKQKTFFFFAYEGLRQHVPMSVTTSVPTELQKAGDFSQTFTSAGQLIPIYDPWSTKPDPDNPGQYIRAPFAGNKIPSDRINPVAANIQKYYPKPTSAGLPGTGLQNFYFSGASIYTTNNYSARVDHQLNDNTSLMGKYSVEYMPRRQGAAWFGEDNVASPGFNNTPQHHPFAIGKLSKTFSPTVFGEFLFSWAREHFQTVGLSNGYDPTGLGFPSYFASESEGALGFPGINPGEMAGLGGYYDNLSVADRYEAKANVWKVWDKHTIKTGVLYGMGKFRTWASDYATGAFSSSRAFTSANPLVSVPNTGFGYASFLLGTMSGGEGNPKDVGGDYRQPYFGFYLQDDIRVTPKLTLNLGVRWDYESPRTEENNATSNFDYYGTATLSNGAAVRGGLMYPGVGGVPRGHWNPSKKNFAPRFGYAYSLGNDTVLRGGFGMFYANSWGSGGNNGSLPQTGYVCHTPVATSLDGGLTPYAVLSDPFPTGYCRVTGNSAGLLSSLGQSLTYLDRNQKIPYLLTWNFDIQRALPWGTVAEIAYSGSRGIHLTAIQEWNQLNPQYMSLGSALTEKVSNPYYGVITQGTLSGETITRAQSLRPYAQFTDVSSRAATYGQSSYHSLLLKVQRRLAQGFSISGSYTVSKSIDNSIASPNGFPGEPFQSSGPQNFYNLDGERALSSWDTPQTLAISYVYELPFGPGKPFAQKGGALGKLVGGWQVNGITLFQSGFPLQITGGNSSGTMNGTQRPNWNGKDATLSGEITDRLLKYFDTSVFSFNAPYTFGNAPRFMPNLRCPGNANFDISLMKNTKVTEKASLQFRAEAFNAFNRVQFGVPNTNINSTSFGVMSSQQNTPRSIQLGLRLTY